MTGKSCLCANGTPARSRPRPTPSCPRRGTPTRIPAAAHRRAGSAARRARRQPPAGRGQRGGTGGPAGAAVGTARPGDLEPRLRRRGRLTVLVRRTPAARPGPAGQRRTAPRAPQRHPCGAPPGDRPGAARLPPQEKTLWRMLYETAIRACEVIVLNIGPRLGRPPRPGPLQGGRYRMICWGWHRAPAVPPYPRPPSGTGVSLRTPPRPCLPTRSQGLVLCHRTGQARLRPRPGPVHLVHRVGAAPAPPRPPISASKVSRCS